MNAIHRTLVLALLWSLLWALLWALAGCTRDPMPEPAADAPVRLANPASTHCVKSGGRLTIETHPAGEFGICLFEDNRQCEEWALMRGECPMGGVRVTGYATAAGRYCAITGGRYSVTAGHDASDERGNCALPGGKVCEAETYYSGGCGP